MFFFVRHLKVFHGSIITHLESETLVSPCQPGFRPGLSTITQLTHVHLLINNHISLLNCIAGVYTDHSRAFNSISHKKLELKLQACGVYVSLMNWIEFSIAEKSLSVVTNSIFSCHKPCISNVPQRSVVSFLECIIFINDLPDYIKHSSILFYADDAKLLNQLAVV